MSVLSSQERTSLILELQRAMQRSTMWTVLLHSTTAGKAGMNVTDAQCVNLLVLDGPMTPGGLAQAMGITTGGAITAVVDRLEKAGYVRRTRDPDDRRRVIVRPVPEAVAGLAHYFDPIARASAENFEDCTQDQLRFLLDFFHKSNSAMPGVVKEIQQLP
ncbi:MAG: transcriptional regulator, MarR family [Streptosporangiaceae bacterium]|nr:transcriptional regulator, MarR family [Streptosporangiaceae bacterium]